MAITATLVINPSQLQATAVASAGTTPITLVAGSGTLVVRLWGWILGGGTSITVADSVAGNLTGAIPTSSVLSQSPDQPYADGVLMFPLFESGPGNTLTITPAAGGLNGIVWWSQT